MKKVTAILLMFVLVGTISGCIKQRGDDMKLIVDYPIANVGDYLAFSVKGSPDSNAGVRWDMGDGTPEFSGAIYNNHQYFVAGVYTVTVQVFLEDETVTLNKDVTIKQP